MKNDDEAFMHQFTTRLNLEPAPKWSARRREFPWLEIAWAALAAFTFAVYWTELRFGFEALTSSWLHRWSVVQSPFVYMIVGAAFVLTGWMAKTVEA